MSPEFRLIIGAAEQVEDDEVAFSFRPREGAICRKPAQPQQKPIGLIDQAVNLRLMNEKPYSKFAFCDLQAETTLAAAIAAGAEVDSDICDHVVKFCERESYGLIGLDRNPCGQILKAYIQSVMSNTMLHDDYAERAAGFWFRDIHKPKIINAWAKEYNIVNRFRCNMIQRKVKHGVTMVKSVRYPIWDINTDTFIWLKPVVSNFCDVFIGTLEEDPGFMVKAHEIFLDTEKDLLAMTGNTIGDNDKWTLSEDRRWLRSPRKYVSRIGHAVAFEVITQLVRYYT